MNEIALKNPFGTNTVNLEHKLMTQTWHNENAEMEDEDFKEIMIACRDLIVQHQLERVLVDARQINYVTVPKMQKWINHEIGAHVMHYNKKIAFVMPRDLFEQIAIRQSMDDMEKSEEDNTKYFEDIAGAMEWLME